MEARRFIPSEIVDKTGNMAEIPYFSYFFSIYKVGEGMYNVDIIISLRTEAKDNCDKSGTSGISIYRKIDMKTDYIDDNPGQEWQWCLVGNIVEEHEYGEEHTIKFGNRQFRPNAKVFINMVYGGMGHENILVIGMPRHYKKYIEIVIARKYVYNFRMQKVFKPAVLKRINNSRWDWWGNTDEARSRIINFLEYLNPDEAVKEKEKLLYSNFEKYGEAESADI